jgi:hypothetical protein
MKVVENFRPTVTQPQRRFIALNPLPSVQIGPYFDRSDVYYVFLALVLSLTYFAPVVQNVSRAQQIHYSRYIVV